MNSSHQVFHFLYTSPKNAWSPDISRVFIRATRENPAQAGTPSTISLFRASPTILTPPFLTDHISGVSQSTTEAPLSKTYAINEVIVIAGVIEIR